jgi:hypothetical protein
LITGTYVNLISNVEFMLYCYCVYSSMLSHCCELSDKKNSHRSFLQPSLLLSCGRFGSEKYVGPGLCQLLVFKTVCNDVV